VTELRFDVATNYWTEYEHGRAVTRHGSSIQASVGDPCDEDGNAVPCELCGRVGSWRKPRKDAIDEQSIITTQTHYQRWSRQADPEHFRRYPLNVTTHQVLCGGCLTVRKEEARGSRAKPKQQEEQEPEQTSSDNLCPGPGTDNRGLGEAEVRAHREPVAKPRAGKHSARRKNRKRSPGVAEGKT